MDKKEGYIPLTDTPREIPGTPHIGTVIRWATVGVLLRTTRERVKLRTTKIGGRRFTTRACIEEFINRLNESSVRTTLVSRRRTQDIANAESEMDTEGIE